MHTALGLFFIMNRSQTPQVAQPNLRQKELYVREFTDIRQQR
jgi:hypothetical protein